MIPCINNCKRKVNKIISNKFNSWSILNFVSQVHNRRPAASATSARPYRVFALGIVMEILFVTQEQKDCNGKPGPQGTPS